jgi:hypothetical protein
MEVDKLQKFNPSQQFANFFIAYSRAFNIQEKRRGGLMERPFCRKEVDSLQYFKDLVIYIHRNPVHHGITASPKDYLTTLPSFTTLPNSLLLFSYVNNRYPAYVPPYRHFVGEVAADRPDHRFGILP